MYVFLRRSRALSAATAIAALLGCVADSGGPAAPSVSPTKASVTGGAASGDATSTDTTVFQFAVNTKKLTLIDLGSGNSLLFPALSVCDLSATYGVDQWDQPCVPATGVVHIKGKWWQDAFGHPHVDFADHVRFVPSDDPTHWVILTFTDASAALYSSSAILYCGTLTGDCIDESTLDPTLTTIRDSYTGTLTRRIKHFSGYEVITGRDGTDSTSTTP